MNDGIALLLTLTIMLAPYLFLWGLLAFSERFRQWRLEWWRKHYDLWIEIEEPDDVWTLERRGENELEL